MTSTSDVLKPERHDAAAAIAVVPARLASTRLPRKMLLDLGGAPLVVRVCENLLASRVFARIVVATDGPAIAEVVRAAGFEAIVTEATLTSGTDRVAACAKTLGVQPEALIVNVQGDEPFVSRELLAAVVERLRRGDRDIVTACTAYHGPGYPEPDVVKVVRGADDRALYFSRAEVPALRENTNAASRGLLRHVGVYGFRASVLAEVARLPPHPLELTERLEQLRWLAHGYGIRAVHVAEPGAFGIDTASDLARANERYRGRQQAV